jgi:hypothetical protein
MHNHSSLWKNFSPAENGPLYRLGRAAGFPEGPRGLLFVGLTLAVVAWIPLFLLSAAEGTLTSGPTVPFLPSLGTHARFLLAIPLFFAAQILFNRRIQQALLALVTSKVIPDAELPHLDAALQRAGRWLGSWVLEAAVLGLTFGLMFFGVRSDLTHEVSTWRTAGDTMSMAGRWYSAVSLPIFQFLFWRWCAFILVWCAILWKISRFDLRLIPTHPDLAGGLGALGVVHVALAPWNFAVCAMLVASFAESILYGGRQLAELTLPLTGAIAGTTLLAVLPLFFFIPALINAKQRGMIEYAPLATRYVRDFDAKWIRGAAPDEPLLGSADVQSLADLSNAFNVIRSMRLVPITVSQVLVLAVASAFPAAPLVLFVVPLDELILRGVRTILHV